MVRELIDCKGERHLYEQLLEYLTEHNYAKSTKTQLERKALELHADRIFDNEAWVEVQSEISPGGRSSHQGGLYPHGMLQQTRSDPPNPVRFPH